MLASKCGSNQLLSSIRPRNISAKGANMPSSAKVEPCKWAARSPFRPTTRHNNMSNRSHSQNSEKEHPLLQHLQRNISSAKFQNSLPRAAPQNSSDASSALIASTCSSNGVSTASFRMNRDPIGQRGRTLCTSPQSGSCRSDLFKIVSLAAGPDGYRIASSWVARGIVRT